MIQEAKNALRQAAPASGTLMASYMDVVSIEHIILALVILLVASLGSVRQAGLLKQHMILP